MRATEYRRLRESIGTQERVAELLGVHRVTVARREAGDPRYEIDREAELALRYLAECRAPTPTGR